MSFHPFSASKARAALAANAMSQADEFKCYFGNGLIGLAYSYQWGFFGLTLNWFLLYDIAVFLAIFWIGASEAYKSNGGSTGADFIKRLTVLGLPLSFSVFVVGQVIYFLGWLVFPLGFAAGAFRDPAWAWQMFIFVFTSSLQVWFWWRMCQHLRRISPPVA